MLADYVMKGIDCLFSDKLSSNSHILTINPNPYHRSQNHNFNRDVIKKQLNFIIKKGIEASKSPKARLNKSPSIISKSRLKCILEDNKDERLRSVVKKSSTLKRQTSPYKRIEIDTQVGCKLRQVSDEDLSNKENNIIKYYREMRKSIDRCQQHERQTVKQHKKSRIFMQRQILSGNISKTDLRVGG